ncbi:hypothetical protein SWPG_00187, partial [Synechococcus phage S-CBM2]
TSRIAEKKRKTILLTNFSPLMKLYLTVVLAFGVILGWNVFLIQRDNKMFEGYKNRQAQICAQMQEWHPDCKIE